MPGLPVIGNIEGWAFIMIEGNGLTLPALVKSPITLPGFAVGCGFGFSCEYGVGPVGFEFGATAIAGLGTRPLIVAAQAKVEGSLHLGPVSISAYADAILLLSEAVQYAEFEVCGEIDLWLTTLRGCARLTLGEQISGEPPPPVPIPRISVILVDRRYRTVATATDTSAAAPVVWTDCIPILSFEVGPASNVTTGSFSASLQPSGSGTAESAEGIVGSDALSYRYELTELTIVELGTSGEIPLAGPLPAMWQVPRDLASDATARGSRELALLTLAPALWSHRLSESPKNAPLDPVPRLVNGCDREESARPGWALAENGFVVRGYWRWPVEPVEPLRFASRFGVEISSRVDSGSPALVGHAALSEWLTPLLPGSSVAVDANLVPVPPGIRLPQYDSAPIEGLRIATILGRPEDIEAASIIETGLAFLSPGFDVASPLVHASLWIGIEGREPSLSGLSVVDDNGTAWEPTEWTPISPSYFVVRLGPPSVQASTPVKSATLSYPWGYQADLLGLQATTVEAQQAASSHRKAVKAAASAQQAANQVPVESRKPLLTPGATYRIDLTVKVSGTRKDRPDKAPVAKEFDPVHRSFWFQTATKAAAPLLIPGSKGELRLRLSDQKAFQPDQLDRYLDRYLPPDRAQFVFCDDPVGVDFAFDHVIGMAKLHGFDFTLDLKRTDLPASVDTTTTKDGPLAVAFSALDVVELGSPAERWIAELKAEAGANCPVPAAGIRASAPVRLARAGTYDLAAAFKPPGDGEASVRLTGTSFGTSRYRTPRELLDDLLATSAGNSKSISGDVEIVGSPVLPDLSTDDLASNTGVESVLAGWKLTPWPGLGRRISSVTREGPSDHLLRGSAPAGAMLVKTLSESPRSTALWVERNGTWHIVGVLLEAPEPIERPGRLTLASATLGGKPFDKRIANRVGNRILFITSEPFPPGETDLLELRATELPSRVSLAVSIPFSSKPNFAEDVS
ncbi:hypothetical protein ACD578_07775 [Microvirga sp. RSM25]|uniref:hypothetical protein n=1 Tax=Microvirga sp. RSM25 TaxID=3273802 RepID=UPI00384AB252